MDRCWLFIGSVYINAFEQIMHAGASRDANLDWKLFKFEQFEQVCPNLSQTCPAIRTVYMYPRNIPPPLATLSSEWDQAPC